MKVHVGFLSIQSAWTGLSYETRKLFRGYPCFFINIFLFKSNIMSTLTGIQIEGNLITFDLTTELLSNELKGQTPKDFGIAQTSKLEDETAIAWGDAKIY